MIFDAAARDTSEKDDAPDTEDQDGPTWEDILRELPPFEGHAEHAALIHAMEDQAPGCDGLETFVRDTFVDPQEVKIMRGICRACPVLNLCDAFAVAGKPRVGMWAGKTPIEIRRGAAVSGDARTLIA